LFPTSFFAFTFLLSFSSSSSSSFCFSSFAFLTRFVLNLAAPISAYLAFPRFAGSSAVKTIADVFMTFFLVFYPKGSTLSTNFS